MGESKQRAGCAKRYGHVEIIGGTRKAMTRITDRGADRTLLQKAGDRAAHRLNHEPTDKPGNLQSVCRKLLAPVLTNYYQVVARK